MNAKPFDDQQITGLIGAEIEGGHQIWEQFQHESLIPLVDLLRLHHETVNDALRDWFDASDSLAVPGRG